MPLNSTPISIPIPNSAVTSSAAWVTFLPIQEGHPFIASLDNALGNPCGSISDIIAVQPSPTGNTTCLPSGEPNPRRFSLSGPVSQCQPFNVTYNTTLVDRSPSIRAFRPLHSSFAINETAPADGRDTYLMSATRQTEVVLLFDDGLGYREISDLVAVGGDTTSDDACVLARKDVSHPEMDEKSSSSKGKISKSAVIGISVVVGLVAGGLAILMIIYVSRERRRRRELQLSHFVNSQMDGRRPSSGNALPTIAGHGFSTLPDTPQKPPLAPTLWSIYYPKDNAQSLASVTQGQSRADSQLEIMRQNIRGKAVDGAAGSVAGLSMDQQSLSSLDIEHILNMATIYSEPPLPPLPVEATSQIPSPLLTVPPFSRHLRNPSDVPADLTPHQSMSLFPSRSDRISNVSYAASQRLSGASQSRPSSYNPMSAAAGQWVTKPPTSSQVNGRVLERVSSFPVSVTSLSPPRQPWDRDMDLNRTSTSSRYGRAEEV
jgi:hypothetical protein